MIFGVMKRLKRFVLAENTEKEPVWKSSDNLMAGVSIRVNGLEISDKDDSENNEINKHINFSCRGWWRSRFRR